MHQSTSRRKPDISGMTASTRIYTLSQNRDHRLPLALNKPFFCLFCFRNKLVAVTVGIGHRLADAVQPEDLGMLFRGVIR